MTWIAVYCGANHGADPAFARAARALGAAMAERGIGLVYGGGHVGLMGAVADAVLAAGGDAHGVITAALVEAEIAHGGLGTLDVVDSMHERKARMAEVADAVVVLPGGFGTLDEALELLTWNQLGLVAMPVVFFDVGGYYEHLFRFFDAATAAGLVRPAHRALAQRASTVDEVLTLALAPAPATARKWLDPGDAVRELG